MVLHFRHDTTAAFFVSYNISKITCFRCQLAMQPHIIKVFRINLRPLIKWNWYTPRICSRLYCHQHTKNESLTNLASTLLKIPFEKIMFFTFGFFSSRFSDVLSTPTRLENRSICYFVLFNSSQIKTVPYFTRIGELYTWRTCCFGSEKESDIFKNRILIYGCWRFVCIRLEYLFTSMTMCQVENCFNVSFRCVSLSMLSVQNTCISRTRTSNLLTF